MSDFEDRVGRALGEGAEGAPEAAGLGEGARVLARRRRTRRRISFAGAAALVLALVLPFTLPRGGIARDAATVAADAGPGWQTLSFERERRGAGAVTVLVDVPEEWATLSNREGPCQAYDVGAPQPDGCDLSEVMGVVVDGGNIDYTYGPGLVAGGDYPYPVSADWIGHVDLGGIYVNASSNDRQVALRVLGSARLEGTSVPDLSEDWATVASNGVSYPLPPLAAGTGYGVEVEPRRPSDEYVDPVRVDPRHWRASATVGDKRIEIIAPTSAIAQLVAGSARLAGPGAGDTWETVTYEGDPLNESGDNRMLLDLPSGWARLDTSECEGQVPRFGPTQTDLCDDESTVSLYGSELFDPCCPPGLFDEGSAEGYVYAGRLVAVVNASDYETARRILASVRLPGQFVQSAIWRTEEVQGSWIDVPDSGAVTLGFDQPFTDDVPRSRAAREVRGGSWFASVGVGPGTAITITARTQALADLVASTVRPATDGGGWHTVSYDGEARDAKGNAVTFEAPSGWDRLDSNLCRIAVPRFGPPGTDPCEDDTVVSFYDVAAAYDDAPGLDGPDDTDGIKRLGDLVAYVDAPDHDTASRILESLRLAG